MLVSFGIPYLVSTRPPSSDATAGDTRSDAHRRVNRNATMRRSVVRGSWFGDVSGFELRSVSGSPARHRSTHRFAVAGEH